MYSIADPTADALGGVEMEAARWYVRPARMLRSVLIAAAGAGLWMVVSASAATADSGSPLLDGLSSTVSSVTGAASSTSGTAIGSLTKVPESAPAVQKVTNVTRPLSNHVAVLAPVPDPVTSEVSRPIETVDASLGDTVPAVAGHSEPVVDAVVAPLVQDVVTPVVEDANVPVLQPVTEAVDALVPPVMVPGGVPLPILDQAVPGVTDELFGTPSRADISDPQPSMVAQDLSGPAITLAGSARAFWKPALAPERWPATAADAGQDSRGIPDGNLPAGPPSWPAGNAAGTGAGNGPAGGPAGSPAWLQGGFALIPLSSDSLAIEAAQHLPPPVSFDPGSSPD